MVLVCVDCKMNSLLTALTACGLLHSVHAATASVDWCYHDATCNDSKWPVTTPLFCNGTRQSPVNIRSSAATQDSSLKEFHFTNFDSPSVFTRINNTGRTVEVELGSGVKISGGGLLDSYDSIQFHLHWGNGRSVPGSEHTVDGKRYPMELHIVNVKSSYLGNMKQAMEDSTGLAALSFLIEAQSGEVTGSPASWKTLTSYLKNITEKDHSIPMAPGISLNDLLVGVDRTKYYRYLGSLTIPSCNQAVVWTVFKDSIKVSADLFDLFSSTVRIGGNTSALMTNTYRSIQADQPVKTTITTNGCLAAGCTLGLISLCLSLLLGNV